MKPSSCVPGQVVEHAVTSSPTAGSAVIHPYSSSDPAGCPDGSCRAQVAVPAQRPVRLLAHDPHLGCVFSPRSRIRTGSPLPPPACRQAMFSARHRPIALISTPRRPACRLGLASISASTITRRLRAITRVPAARDAEARKRAERFRAVTTLLDCGDAARTLVSSRMSSPAVDGAQRSSSRSFAPDTPGFHAVGYTTPLNPSFRRKPVGSRDVGRGCPVQASGRAAWEAMTSRPPRPRCRPLRRQVASRALPAAMT